MLPLPQNYVGSTCDLKSLDNCLIAVGHIIEIDHDALEIVSPEGKHMPLFQYRLPVKICVHNSLGFRILVGITYLSTDRFVRLEEVKPLQDFERRGAFRVSSSVPGTLYPLLSDTQRHSFEARLASLPPNEAEALQASTFFDVVVTDISLTGVRLNSPKSLHEKDLFHLEFTPLKTQMIFQIVVARIIPFSHEKPQYGCRFINTTNRQSDILCRDLFTLQRIEKNRRNNHVSPL